MNLEAAASFNKIQDILNGVSAEAFECHGHPSFERLGRALVGRNNTADKNPWSRSPLDLAVLIRQVLRHEDTRRADPRYPAALEVPLGEDWPDIEQWKTVGAEIKARGANRLIIKMKPWSPDWLLGDHGPVEAEASKENPIINLTGDPLNPDPFLARVGKKWYRSPGQRSGIRSALTMPPGASLLVCLPTGEGKSLVFDCIDQVGFGGLRPGVTPVIVPTVALALDHEKNQQQRLNDSRPRAYAGDQSPTAEFSRQNIRKAIREGTQGLCFVSPEAACGSLRNDLIQACRDGYLGTLVIDEAHLVEGWGADFRTEFQALSGLWTEMLRNCSEERALRTVMLSATLNQQSFDTLLNLFTSPDREFGLVYGGRLRPELQFFVARTTEIEDVRQTRVLEALSRLPRPLILYVTKPDEAEVWFRLLKQKKGYASLGMVHGRTQPHERERVLEGWRRGELDMVVGTSAFGLGIDYRHVRSVVHACIPETLDRFYQEVGRGGRDGCASISLIIPTLEDESVARGLNKKKIITPKRALERWEAMFHHDDKKDLGNFRYRLRLDVSPRSGDGDLDMVGGRNTDWNARVLTVMARAGIIRLVGIERDRASERYDMEVEIIDGRYTSEEFWDERISRVRDEVKSGNRLNLKLMRKYLRGEGCPGELLKTVYTLNIDGQTCQPAYSCGGCPVCGQRGEPSASDFPTPPPVTWCECHKMDDSLSEMLANGRRLVVYYPAAQFTERKFRRQFGDILNILFTKGFHNLFVLSLDESNIGEFALTPPFFLGLGSLWLHKKSLPVGPEIVLMKPNWRLKRALPSVKPIYEQIIFMPDDMPDPGRPQRFFKESYGDADLGFENFRMRI